MKKLFLTIALFFSFSVYGIAVDTNDNDTYFENYVLSTLIQNDEKDIDNISLNTHYDVYKSIIKAEEAYFKAKLKDVQSDKVFVTKADVLKKCYIEAIKAGDEAYKIQRSRVEVAESSSATDNLANKNLDIRYSSLDTAKANAAKMFSALRKTETETIEPNSNKALKLYNKAAKFYDKAINSYRDIVIACSSINPDIIKEAEKVKGTKQYARYEAYITKKRKATEFWTREQTYVKKLKDVCEADARVASVHIELYEAAKTYDKTAKTYAKAAKTYAKVAKNSIKSSIEIPEADRLDCFEFEDAVELHKSHKISDAQLASVPASKAYWETMNAYAVYCRTKLKFSETIVAACREHGEAVNLQTELNKSFVEQDRVNVLCQAECVGCY
jgi:tetratricopeptide (TPR) repeat protein